MTRPKDVCIKLLFVILNENLKMHTPKNSIIIWPTTLLQASHFAIPRENEGQALSAKASRALPLSGLSMATYNQLSVVLS